MYKSHFLDSSINTRLVCFYILAITHSAAMNMEVQTSLQKTKQLSEKAIYGVGKNLANHLPDKGSIYKGLL